MIKLLVKAKIRIVTLKDQKSVIQDYESFQCHFHLDPELHKRCKKEEVVSFAESDIIQKYKEDLLKRKRNGVLSQALVTTLTTIPWTLQHTKLSVAIAP